MLSSCDRPAVERPASRTAPLALAVTLLLALLGAGVGTDSAAAAEGATVTRTVSATIVHDMKPSPTTPETNCSVVAFAEWIDVPGTTSATARYQWAGTPSEKTSQPPFDDVYDHVAVYTAPPGTHRINLSVSWSAGAGAQATCTGMLERQKAALGSTATVELTLPAPKPARITPIRTSTALGATRTAPVARVTCPTGGSCKVTVPKTVSVRIAGTKYTLGVSAPSVVRGGRSAVVTVTFPRAAVTALVDRTTRPSVRVRAVNTGAAPTVLVVQRTIRGA